MPVQGRRTHEGDGLLQLVERGSDALREAPARGGEAQAASVALDEVDAEILGEGGNLAADGARRDIEIACGGRDGTAAREGVEGPEGIEPQVMTHG